MEKHRITALPVTDSAGVLVGALNVHDPAARRSPVSD
jgi:CBS domain-containing protein